MKRFALMLLALTLTGLTGQAFAVSVTLNPQSANVQTGQNVFVDVNVFGLQSGGSNSLLGAFGMDVLFDPNLQFISADFGSALGDLANNAETAFSADWLPGTGSINLTEMSFLDSLALAPLQGDSFRLATLTFNLPQASNLPSGSSVTFSTANVLLSDAAGVDISVNNVSEPPVLFLLALGLIPLWLRNKHRNSADKNPLDQFRFLQINPAF